MQILVTLLALFLVLVKTSPIPVHLVDQAHNEFLVQDAELSLNGDASSLRRALRRDRHDDADSDEEKEDKSDSDDDEEESDDDSDSDDDSESDSDGEHSNNEDEDDSIDNDADDSTDTVTTVVGDGKLV